MMRSFSNEHLQKAFEIEKIGVWKWDVNHHRIVICCMLKHFTGIAADDFLDENTWWSYYHPEDRQKITSELQALIQGKISMCRYDIRLLHPDGTYHWYSEKALVLQADENNHPIQIIGVVHDITERKSLEHQLKTEMSQLLSIADMLENMQRKKMDASIKELNEALILKNKELEQIIYITSHDLRSPLVNIQGFTKEIANSLQLFSKKIKIARDLEQLKTETEWMIQHDIPDSLNYVITNADKMDALLKAVQRFSRISRTVVQWDMVNTNNILSDVIRNLRTTLIQHDVVIETHELPTVYADERLLQQVFYNIIENAIKFMKPNQQSYIKIYASSNDSMVTFCIEDNGIGIPEQYHEKIFEIFDRLDISKKGEGVGLALVKKIMERLHGKLWLTSTPEVGTTFYFSLYKNKKAMKG